MALLPMPIAANPIREMIGFVDKNTVMHPKNKSTSNVLATTMGEYRSMNGSAKNLAVAWLMAATATAKPARNDPALKISRI